MNEIQFSENRSRNFASRLKPYLFVQDKADSDGRVEDKIKTQKKKGARVRLFRQMRKNLMFNRVVLPKNLLWIH